MKSSRKIWPSWLSKGLDVIDGIAKQHLRADLRAFYADCWNQVRKRFNVPCPLSEKRPDSRSGLKRVRVTPWRQPNGARGFLFELDREGPGPYVSCSNPQTPLQDPGS